MAILYTSVSQPMVRGPLVVREVGPDGPQTLLKNIIKQVESKEVKIFHIKWTLDVKVFKILENTGPIASFLTFAVMNHSLKPLTH
jgi:hypothetical protein